MVKWHGRNTAVFFNALDCSGQLNTGSITPNITTANSSAFTDDWDTFLEGPANFTGSFAGFWDAAGAANVAKIFDALFSYINGGPKILLVYPAGSGAAKPYFYGTAIMTGLPVSMNRTDAVGLSVSLQGTGQLKNFSQA